MQAAGTVDASRLQALGESGVLVTPVEMLIAYHRLAARVSDEKLGPIIEGLEGAVDYGTAQRASVAGVKVAGKTGSVTTGEGIRAAWFAGFAPARAPEVVVTAVVQGRSGGADAAPIAGRLLEAHFAGRL
jgi:cell division protein FtsI/penicillin-binding protein 2